MIRKVVKAYVPVESEAGRRFVHAKMGNAHHSQAHQGQREIERRQRQLQRKAAK